MSKNIFDEAKTMLENICIDFDEHGYAPTIPSHRDSDLHFSTIYKKEINKIDEALEKAQKQEKLLELYIDLGNKIQVLDDTQGYGILEIGEIKNICNKIKNKGVRK